MRVLVACEFSGVVREAFTKKGHDAWSCDLLDSETPGQHFKGDVLEILEDGWDLMIAHPPCQFLSYAGNVWLKKPGRIMDRSRAFIFFKKLADANVKRIAIENPKGIARKWWRQEDQVIQPWQFGHPCTKATCLWLKNLQPLAPTKIVEPEKHFDGKRNRNWVDRVGGGSELGRKKRSKTFRGIAEAMAEQWGIL